MLTGYLLTTSTIFLFLLSKVLESKYGKPLLLQTAKYKVYFQLWYFHH